MAKHEHPTDGTYQDCPNTQEPEIGGNSGNSGNGQQLRGLQAFPPYKRSGNRWEHTHFFEHKSQSPPFVLVITVPTKEGVGTKTALSHQLEASSFGAVHTVPTVPTLFGISGTFVLWLFGGGEAMSLLAELFEGLETSTAGIDTLKTERIGSTAPALRFALSENVARDVTMNSREIAVLVGARHADVMQTIDRLIEKNVVLGCTPSAYTHEQNGQPYAQSLQLVDQHDGEPKHLIHTAATATLEWIAARDQYVSHLMACCACYAPSGRYCAAGVELRQQYEQTPWERQP